MFLPPCSDVRIALVQYETKERAMEAAEELNGTELDGQDLEVTHCTSKYVKHLTFIKHVFIGEDQKYFLCITPRILYERTSSNVLKLGKIWDVRDGQDLEVTHCTSKYAKHLTYILHVFVRDDLKYSLVFANVLSCR